MVALDVPSAEQAKTLVGELRGSGVKWKVGKQLFTIAGPAIVGWIQGKGEQVFLDLKYHDILETVRKASVAAADLGVLMFNIHVQREATMRAVTDALKNISRRPKVLGVTVLTDYEAEDVASLMGWDSRTMRIDVEQLVLHRARLAQRCGLDGVVCSVKEVRAIRSSCGWDFLTVVPGVRSLGKDAQDQKRVGTPERAIIDGADYLVSGRQITEASDPGSEVQRIAEEIKNGMRMRLARRLREIKAVDFNLADPWKIKIHDELPEAPKSPFYIDQRIIRSFPSFLEEVADVFVELLKNTGPRPDLLCDVPTTITPIVAVVSQKMGIPMISPRLDVKTHGIKRAIDGVWKLGQSVVVLDDLRTTGGSKKEVLDILRGQGLKVLRVIALIDRGTEGPEIDGVPFFAEYPWEEMLDLYKEEGVISAGEYSTSQRYPQVLAIYRRSIPNF